MRTNIQKRIENAVTNERGYLRIPTSRIFGDKRALRKWFEFSKYLGGVNEVVNGESNINELKLPFPLSYLFSIKPKVKDDEILFSDYDIIKRRVEINQAINFLTCYHEVLKNNTNSKNNLFWAGSSCKKIFREN